MELKVAHRLWKAHFFEQMAKPNEFKPLWVGGLRGDVECDPPQDVGKQYGVPLRNFKAPRK